MEEVKRLLDFYCSKVELDPSISNYRGGLTDEAFGDVWRTIRSRKRLYEASIAERGVTVREQYVVAPRDLQNIVQEAASEASFASERWVTMDRMLPLLKSILTEDRA